MSSFKYLVYFPKVCSVQFVNLAKQKLEFFIKFKIKRLLHMKFDTSIFFDEVFADMLFIKGSWGLNRQIKILHFIKQILFYCRHFIWRVFKAHGINMRMIRRRKLKRFFLRVGFGHGFYLPSSSVFSVKIYRKRYFMVGGFEKRIFELFSYHLRYLRRFFRYKLIGIKSKRDVFKIKLGKKKTF